MYTLITENSVQHLICNSYHEAVDAAVALADLGHEVDVVIAYGEIDEQTIATVTRDDIVSAFNTY